MKESRGRGEAQGKEKETRHDAIYKSAVASCRKSVIPPTTSGRLPKEKLGVQHKPVTVSVQQVTPVWGIQGTLLKIKSEGTGQHQAWLLAFL